MKDQTNEIESEPPHPRTSGSMAGEIWIAPDFDELPDDVAEAFGIAELPPQGDSPHVSLFQSGIPSHR